MEETAFEGGIAVPTWLNSLASAAAEHIHGVDILSPLGCHCYHNRARDEFELTVFASRTQIIGGHMDGQEVGSSFDVNLGDVMDLFDEPPRVGWQALAKGKEDQLGPHVSFEGTYMGQAVWLRILSQSPDRYEHGRNLNIHTLKLDDLW
jgi:hypothetical protein